jgi:hypothetical protein
MIEARVNEEMALGSRDHKTADAYRGLVGMEGISWSNALVKIQKEITDSEQKDQNSPKGRIAQLKIGSRAIELIRGVKEFPVRYSPEESQTFTFSDGTTFKAYTDYPLIMDGRVGAIPTSLTVFFQDDALSSNPIGKMRKAKLFGIDPVVAFNISVNLFGEVRDFGKVTQVTTFRRPGSGRRRESHGLSLLQPSQARLQALANTALDALVASLHPQPVTSVVRSL